MRKEKDLKYVESVVHFYTRSILWAIVTYPFGFFLFSRDSRVKRKRKRLLQEQQQAKETEQKFEEKQQEKVSKSETNNEDTKNNTTGVVEAESRGGDTTESKVR